VRRLIPQAVLVGNPRHHGQLPAEIIGARADSEQHVAEEQGRQARRKQEEQRHDTRQQETEGRDAQP